MEYTKGQWEALLHSDKRGFNIFSPDKFITSLRFNTGVETMREVSANAQLIAASPSLYEACQMIKRFWESDDLEITCRLGEDPIGKVLEALAKVEK